MDETVPEEFQPDFFRQWIELPPITKYEQERLVSMTSCQIDDYFMANPLDMNFQMKLFFSKARKYLSRYTSEMKQLYKKFKFETIKRRIFYGMSKQCHIVLLANDWTGALQSYQEALHHDPELFSRDPSMYYGLGAVYLHFKHYDMAIEAFSRLLYTFPTGRVAHETRVRLGMCWMEMEDYDRCINLFTLALNDPEESKFMPKFIIRYNIGRSYENIEELDKADLVYNALIVDIDDFFRTRTCEQSIMDVLVKLRGACYRQLGWVLYRRSYRDDQNKAAYLKKAEDMLHMAQKDDPNDGQSYYYMGRVYGDTEPTVSGEKAHEAFVNYRQSIDKAEQNPDTWCSIGALYQRQNQPMDALQAFICAVELNESHSAAWTDLGELYEKNAQYQDALECFKNAMKHSPVAPEPIKARVHFLEKELAMPIPLRPPGHVITNTFDREIPSLKEAYQQPIPRELRTRQDDAYEKAEARYDNAFWELWDETKTSDDVHLHADIEEEYPMPRIMGELELEVLDMLRANESGLVRAERDVLECLETDEAIMKDGIVECLIPESSREMPRVSGDMIEHLREHGHLLESPQTYSFPFLPKVAHTDFPESFSLTSELFVSLDISGNEILAMGSKRVQVSTTYLPVFEEIAKLPEAPKDPVRIASEEEVKAALERDERHPLIKKTSILTVENRKEAHCVELQRYLDSSTISCIRGLTGCLRLDLSLFSTKAVVEAAGNQELEVRTQYQLPPETNCDHASQPTWKCISDLTYTSINEYSHYQAESFKHTLKVESEKMRKSHTVNRGPTSPKKQRMYKRAASPPKILKSIKFGTNIDLSDDTKWKAQINELSKLPAFCRLIAGSNMLSHLGHQVNGMNTIRLDMKVPGSRIPCHQESNFMAAVNINIGPGDCEWFAVPYEYWGMMEKICAKRGIDFFKGIYWPIMDDLLDAGIPVHRFTQKAGDMVYVSGGAMHWCQATGWCNTISWDVAPLNYTQLSMSLLSYEYNKLRRFKSNVPMQLLCWQVAKNVRFTNQALYNLIKGVLIRSLAFLQMVHDLIKMHMKKAIKTHPRASGEQAHFCMYCESEVFGILFLKDMDGKFNVFCAYCAKSSGQGLENFIALQQFTFPDLLNIYDNMKCVPANPAKMQLTA